MPTIELNLVLGIWEDVGEILRMNKLSSTKRAQILGMLVEGMSMRAITRITGVSINTVAKRLNDAGHACTAYHHEHVRGFAGIVASSATRYGPSLLRHCHLCHPHEISPRRD